MKSKHPTIEQLLARTKKNNECMEWSSKRLPSGYGVLQINKKRTYAHRAMMVAKTGEPIPEGMLVLHSCDNKCCINPNHLRIGTYKDNALDAKIRGRLKYPPPGSWSGTKNPKSVLTDKQRKEIINMLSNGYTATEISEIFSVTAVRCGQIRKEAGLPLIRKRRWGVRPKDQKVLQ